MSILKLLLLFVLVSLVFSRSMPNLAVGRWSRTLTFPPQVDRFLRQRHPELQGARVIHIESQVVSGTNYKITYQGSFGRALAEVSYQSWNNAIKERSFRKL